MIYKSLNLSIEGLIMSLFMSAGIAVNGNKKALKSVVDKCEMLINEKCDDILLRVILIVAFAIDNRKLERKALKSSKNIDANIEFIKNYKYVRKVTGGEDLIVIGEYFMIFNGFNPERAMSEAASGAEKYLNT